MFDIKHIVIFLLAFLVGFFLGGPLGALITLIIAYQIIYTGPKKADKQLNSIKIIIQKHIRELSINKQKLIVNEGYGKKNSNLWDKELQHFIDNVIKTEITDLSIPANLIFNIIDEEVKKFNSSKVSSDYSDELDPYEYEHFCAKLLSQSGWDAAATKASGDQGADVIAEKNGKKIIIQCKKYSHPVGNKAVQEVYTAVGFYKADFGAVVTNSSFTKSAKTAANLVNILLLHHDDLPYIDDILTKV